MIRTKSDLLIQHNMEFKRPYKNFRAAKKTNPNSNEIKWPEPRYVRVKISDRIRVRKLFVFCRKKYKWAEQKKIKKI